MRLTMSLALICMLLAPALYLGGAGSTGPFIPDPGFDDKGGSAIPTWSLEDYWNYTTSFDSPPVPLVGRIPFTGWMRIEVVEADPRPLSGDPCYRLNVTGYAHGHKWVIMIGDIDIYVDIEGYMIQRMQDMSVIEMDMNATVDDSTGYMTGEYPYGVQYRPPLEEYDFPLIPGDSWTITTDVVDPYSGNPSGTPLLANLSCTISDSLDLPIGNVLALPVLWNGEKTTWYNHTIGNSVKRHFDFNVSGYQITAPLELREFSYNPPGAITDLHVSSPQQVEAGGPFNITGNFSGPCDIEVRFPGTALAMTGSIPSAGEFNLTLTAPFGMDATPCPADHASLGVLLISTGAVDGFRVCTVTTKARDLMVNETSLEIRQEGWGTAEDPINVTMRIYNPSNFGAAGFLVDLSIPDIGLDIIELGPFDLEAREHLELTHEFTLDTSGDYELRLMVDGEDAIPEYNESNNEVEFPLRVYERPPLVWSLEPDGGNIRIGEGRWIMLSAEVMRGGDPLQPGNWTVDGSLIASGCHMNFSTNYTGLSSSREEPYNISYTLPEGSYFQGEVNSGYWNVTVEDRNRPPEVADVVPAPGDLELTEGDHIHLSVLAEDPDGDDLSYDWRVDGIETGNDGPVLNFSAEYTGLNSSAYSPYEVVLNLSDSGADPQWVRINWTVDVIDVDRPFTATMDPPEGDIELKTNETLVLTYNATDPDGDTVISWWTYIHYQVNMNQSLVIDPASLGLEGGEEFNVTLHLRSGLFQREFIWDITILEREEEPPVEPMDPSPPVGVVILSPRRGEVIPFGEDIELRALDSDLRDVNFTWNLDGRTFFGRNTTVPPLPSGNYTLELNASCSDPAGWILLERDFSVGEPVLVDPTDAGDEEKDGMPLWGWIIIAFLVLLLVLFISVTMYSVYLRKGEGTPPEE